MSTTCQNEDCSLEDFDFSELDSPDFKEDSVREEIVKPLLNALGYSLSANHRIYRSKKVKHPFVKTASGKRQITIFPDYLLSVDRKYRWVLDAKAPDEEITKGENAEQTYFYAIHPDIRVKYYALCNGREFSLFAIDSDKPLLYFHLSELKQHWRALKSLVSPSVFEGIVATPRPLFTGEEFDYSVALPPREMNTKKQAAKRHFGVHGYFTRQSWDLVQAYIKTFTKPGDVVLDPYGGYGVTAIEALMLDRQAIHVDLNPMAVFIAKSLTAPVLIEEMWNVLERLRRQFDAERPTSDSEVETVIAKYGHPRGIPLARNSDVRDVADLFTRPQLAQLGLLKGLICKLRDENLRQSFLLAFSSTITKINLTYHPSASRGDNAGDSAAFRYYRYRIAPQPIDLDVFNTFALKVKKLVAAKKEMQAVIKLEAVKNAIFKKGTATKLDSISDESIDYIYTDPPYGSKIPYLDLSVMWNAWLGLPVSEEDYQLEAIEGGEHHKTRDSYVQLIAESLREMYRVLKFDRWMSFVFQHKDPAYWHLIVDAAQEAGFEYVGTVTQQIGQTSFKKRQNPFTVLHGQLIISFRKTRDPRALMKLQLGVETTHLVMQTIEALIASRQGATLEEIYSELIVRGMESGFLHELSKEHHSIPALLKDNFDFNEKRQVYQIKKNTKFKTKIPLPLRIKYYLLSYMRQMERRRIYPTFDDIILNIMPLLKNGITPEHQSIESVLVKVAEHVGDGRWRLVEGQQLELHLTDAIEVPKKPVVRESDTTGSPRRVNLSN